MSEYFFRIDDDTLLEVWKAGQHTPNWTYDVTSIFNFKAGTVTRMSIETLPGYERVIKPETRDFSYYLPEEIAKARKKLDELNATA